jgi:GAF domain-containing protein
MNDQDYALLNAQLRALLDGETDALAATSNFVALLYNALSNINWLGVYVVRHDELVLGPFQGQPACVHDVHAFPGHIVCDAQSRSELVVPLLVDKQLIGVLDIDSPSPARFSESDQRGVEKLCATFCELQETRDRFI